jgi:hypothetical protein
MAGKSTLINAMIGKRTLPRGTGQDSTTGIATRIRNNGGSNFRVTLKSRTCDDVIGDFRAYFMIEAPEDAKVKFALQQRLQKLCGKIDNWEKCDKELAQYEKNPSVLPSFLNAVYVRRTVFDV